MAQIEAIFEGAEIERFLRRLEKKAGDIRRGSKELAGIISSGVFSDIIGHFESESGPDGRWAAWSDAYAKHRERSKGKRARGDKILQLTGRLRGSLLPSQGKYKPRADGILFYSPVEYSGIHDRGEGKMPKREFMWLSADAKEKIAETTLRWLAEDK